MWDRIWRSKTAEFIRDAGIIGRLTSMTFKTYEPKTKAQQEALSVCRWYAENTPATPTLGIGLYSASHVGVGKTHLAVAATRRIIERLCEQHVAADCRVTTIHAILDELRTAAFAKPGTDDVTVRGLRERYLSYRILVVDDIGKERADLTDWQRGELFALVEGWYLREKRIIFTSNSSPDEIASRYGEPVASRVLALCGGGMLTIDGEDRRTRDQGFRSLLRAAKGA